MEAVVGLLVLLLGVSHGVETYCDGRQNGTQCYGALGGTLVLRLMDSASEINRYQWSDKTGAVLNGRKDKFEITKITNRSSFTPSNGTFRMNNLSRTDGGEYTLEIFYTDGKISESQTLQLTIQAPVSSVLLVSECLSQGEMRVSCSSEGGDSPQYSWTLDGRTLTDTQLLSGNKESKNITLKQDVSGLLVCSVSNNVSRVSEEKSISTCGFIFIDCISNGTHIKQWVLEANNTLCPEPTTACNPTTEGYLPIMAGVLSALVILLVVGVAVVCAHKKKPNKSKEEEDEQELTYADVRIVQRRERQMPQRAETEVEYGQVKFSERPRQTVKPTADECVYSMVRKGR